MYLLFSLVDLAWTALQGDSEAARASNMATAKTTLRAILLATFVLSAVWLLLSVVAALLDPTIDVDEGWLLLLGLGLWPVVVLGVMRYEGLGGVGPWVAVGLVSFIVSVPVWLTVTLLVFTVGLGYR